MLKITTLSILISLFTIPALAETWPTKIAPIGCKFEFKEDIPNWENSSSIEILEHLSFPKIRVNSIRNGKSASASAASLLGVPDDGSIINSLFCNNWCQTRDKNFSFEQKALFPMKVGNRVEIPAIQKIIIEVLKKRDSPFIDGSTEFFVQTSIDNLGDGSVITPAYSIWWNVDLGFFTERVIKRLATHDILTNASCGIKK